MFTGLTFILSTADLERLLAFSCTALDGEEIFRFPAKGEPAYLALHVGAELGIARDEEASSPEHTNDTHCGCMPRIVTPPRSGWSSAARR
jgi:hypothetical protein